MPKYPYRQLGVSFDRNYRNDLNQNIRDIETDVKEQKGRVDNIIANSPQPSEVVDSRGGFPVLRDRLAIVDEQLAERAEEITDLQTNKMDKATMDIAVSQINKNKGLFDETYFTDTVKQQWAGTTPVNATPPDGGVTTIKLADKAVSPDKIDTKLSESIENLGLKVVYGKNLFNKDTVTLNTLINSNGALTTSTGWSTSDFIEVDSNTEYRFSRVRFILEFDKFKRPITGTFLTVPSGPYTLRTNVNTKYLRFNLETSYLTSAQLEPGNATTSYESYKSPVLTRIDGTPLTIHNVINKQFEVVTGGKNLFNKETALKDAVIASSGSVAFGQTSWTTSDLISVLPNSQIVVNKCRFLAEYDSKGNFISGTYIVNSTEIPTAIITTATTAYIRFTTLSAYVVDSQVEYGNTPTAYESFYYTIRSNDGKKIISQSIDSLIPKKNLDIILPRKIYTSVNDIDIHNGYGRNYSAAIYLDHLINITNYDEDISFQNAKDKKIFAAPVVQGTATVDGFETPIFNNDVSINEATETVKIVGGNYNPVSATLTNVSVKASNGKALKPKILVISDSLGQGQLADTYIGTNYPLENNMTYYAYVKQMFEMDKIDDGDVGNYDAVFVGSYNNKSIPINYKNVSRTVKACAEARGAWSVFNYLRHAGLMRANQESYDALGLGDGTGTDYVGSPEQLLAITSTPEVYTGNPFNPFFDNDKTGTNRFSIAKWLERFRTMDDNGNRLTLGAGTGTNITSENIETIDVCTPTHVIIQLGTNDTLVNTTSDFVANVREMVTEIRTQLPNAYIGISIMPDKAGTLFPSLYPEIQDCELVGHSINYITAKALLAEFTEADEANDIYLLPSYFVAPTAYAFPLREVHLPEQTLLGTWKKESERYFQPFGLGMPGHVSSYAHINWAYQMYSWIKYTLA